MSTENLAGIYQIGCMLWKIKTAFHYVLLQSDHLAQVGMHQCTWVLKDITVIQNILFSVFLLLDT